MIKREMAIHLERLAKQYPVVTVTGPRQAGKTTLIKNTFPEMAYVNVEDPDMLELAEADPRSFLEQYEKGMIIDEVQRMPKLLSYIQTIVDAQGQQPGKFILTGSHQFDLHHAINQSLAGRTALLHLLPLSISELSNSRINLSVSEYLFKGFYPRAYDKMQHNPTELYSNYVKTYLERDVRQIINVKDLSRFQSFIKLLAGRIGQVLNINDLCNSIGISHHTANAWLSVLEASFLVVRLAPYFENFGKRQIKSPKIYFTDVGLASYLLGINDVYQLETHPLFANLFENLVLLEIIKSRFNQSKDHNCYYYRDSNQNEIDFILTHANNLIPIEVKSSKTFNKNFLKGIDYFTKLAKDRVPFGLLVYNGEQEQTVRNVELVHYKKVTKVLGERVIG